jgi:hypothetical protein
MLPPDASTHAFCIWPLTDTPAQTVGQHRGSPTGPFGPQNGHWFSSGQQNCVLLAAGPGKICIMTCRGQVSCVKYVCVE